MRLHSALADELPRAALYGILRLRAEVFVVEQQCVFVDPDGRDLEPGVVHVWATGNDDDTDVVGCARLLPMHPTGTHIGRVVTSQRHRNTRLGKRLMLEALRLGTPPYEIKAQSRLCDWYGQFGFEPSGEEFMDDGILHTPMRID